MNTAENVVLALGAGNREHCHFLQESSVR